MPNGSCKMVSVLFKLGSKRTALKKYYLLFLLFIFCPNLFAQSWKINKDHSEMFFQVEYLNVTDVTGRFNSFSGTVNFERPDLPKEISIRIETSSLDSGNNLRDGHLKSHEFLKSKEHPFITFKSETVSLKKDRNFVATGTLFLASVSRKHSFEFSLSAPKKDTWNYQSRFVKFKSKINRKDFNLVWNKTLSENKYLVGEEISIWGTFQLQPGSQVTPTSKHMIPDTSYIRKREKLNRGELTQDDFDQDAKPSMGGKSPQILKPKTAQVPLTTKGIPYHRDFRQSMTWQVSFWTLGLFGFLAAIIIGLYTKNVIVQKYPDKYREGGRLGIISDSIIIVFVLVYVVAFWEVGWG